MTKAISDFLRNHSNSGPISFHMPGHKGSEFYKKFKRNGFLSDFPDRDVTEIEGADNLFQPEGIIRETMDKYRRLYDAKASYLLINGSSGGIIASILACCRPKDKLIMARNCHKAVFNALALGRLTPVYIRPDRIDEYGIAGSVSPEEVARAVSENPDASAVILPSPNYYGVCSDIRVIADIAHEAGMILIVDQAHGAHLKFFDGVPRDYTNTVVLPPSAENSGADLVINSTHKTLGSLTQSAVLNVCEGNFSSRDENLFELEDKLQAIESSSPSYILMESLDINADILLEQGGEIFENWMKDLVWFYNMAEKIPDLKVMKPDGLDPTKINLDMSSYGLDGSALDRELMRRNIYAELSTGNILMCMSGVGNHRSHYEGLILALRDIAENRPGYYDPNTCKPSDEESHAGLWTLKRRMEDIPDGKELVDIDNAIGRLCASSIIPYPPGIPLVCPGEIITAEDVEYIREMRASGKKVIGVDGEGRVCAGL